MKHVRQEDDIEVLRIKLREVDDYIRPFDTALNRIRSAWRRLSTIETPASADLIALLDRLKVETESMELVGAPTSLIPDDLLTIAAYVHDEDPSFFADALPTLERRLEDALGRDMAELNDIDSLMQCVVESQTAFVEYTVASLRLPRCLRRFLITKLNSLESQPAFHRAATTRVVLSKPMLPSLIAKVFEIGLDTLHKWIDQGKVKVFPITTKKWQYDLLSAPLSTEKKCELLRLTEGAGGERAS